MKLAWFRAPGEVAVAVTPDELRALADDDRSGVAWWIADRHEPTVSEGLGRLEFLERHGVCPYAFTPREPQPRLSIERVWLDNVDVQLLISQLNMDLYSHHPEPGARLQPRCGRHRPGGRRTGDGRARRRAGRLRCLPSHRRCAGLVEVKRTYVTLAGRGKRIGSAFLAELERDAATLGVSRFALEAGPRQPEALGMFEAAGYVVCEPWGSFVGKELSICMAKELPSA